MQEQKNTNLRLLSAAFVACMAWHCCAATPAQSGPDVSVPNRIGVKAGDLRIVLENTERGLRIASLTDMATGQELLAAEPSPLFSAVLRDVQTKELLTLTADSGWKKVDATYSETRGRHTLHFRTPTDDRLAGIRVEVILDVETSDSALTVEFLP